MKGATPMAGQILAPRTIHVPKQHQVSKSANHEIALLLNKTMQAGLSVLAFCKTRKASLYPFSWSVTNLILLLLQTVELILRYSLMELRKLRRLDLQDLVKAYRAGYSKEERREIETQLASGRLRGVVATNALEVGIDIGSLDATLHLGVPYAVSSLWQQAGRAGRRERESVSILVFYPDPLDTFVMKHPEFLLTSRHEVHFR
jgi:DEAD/DEAH box helicase domain-containing protein